MSIKAKQEAAQQFKTLRTEAKITQDAAADACDCSPRSIRSWERGDTQVPAAAFVDLQAHINFCRERMTDPRYR